MLRSKENRISLIQSRQSGGAFISLLEHERCWGLRSVYTSAIKQNPRRAQSAINDLPPEEQQTCKGLKKHERGLIHS